MTINRRQTDAGPIAETDREGEANRAVALAAGLLRRAIELQTPHERRQQAELDRMIHHADDKAAVPGEARFPGGLGHFSADDCFAAASS